MHKPFLIAVFTISQGLCAQAFLTAKDFELAKKLPAPTTEEEFSLFSGLMDYSFPLSTENWVESDEGSWYQKCLDRTQGSAKAKAGMGFVEMVLDFAVNPQTCKADFEAREEDENETSKIAVRSFERFDCPGIDLTKVNDLEMKNNPFTEAIALCVKGDTVQHEFHWKSEMEQSGEEGGEKYNTKSTDLTLISAEKEGPCTWSKNADKWTTMDCKQLDGQVESGDVDGTVQDPIIIRAELNYAGLKGSVGNSVFEGSSPFQLNGGKAEMKFDGDSFELENIQLPKE